MRSGVGMRAMTTQAPATSLEAGVRAAVSFGSIL
jgi:hypothetical protein